MELSADLPPELVPLAWLLGSWAGAGVGALPQEHRFGQEAEFSHDGRGFLTYVSRTWRLTDDGERAEPLHAEQGYWRPLPDGGLDVVLAQAPGYAEIWHGTVAGPRIDLRTDVVARTPDAPEYTAGTRLYGLVEGDLAWAYDAAFDGTPLRALMSARLRRVGAVA